MKLNDATIRALKPAQRQTLYRDSTLPGFGVRVTPKGVKSFCLMHGADRRLTTIGRYPIITLAEARDTARRILAQKTLNQYQPRSIRFSDALDLFVQTHCADIKTGYEYQRTLKREFLPALKSKTLDKITPHDIQDILDDLSPSVAYHAFNYLRAFFTWAIQRSYLDHSPLVRMKRPAKSPSRARVLTDGELKSVWQASVKLETFGAIVRLLIATGQRRGEIAALRADMICENTITLPKELTKNRREHVFPIGPLACGLIPTGVGLFFHAPRNLDKPFRQFGAAKLILNKLCGFSDWTLHDLRRTYRTIHARIGTPPHIAERLINHVSSTPEVQRIYERYTYFPEMVRAVQNYEAELTKIFDVRFVGVDSHAA